MTSQTCAVDDTCWWHWWSLPCSWEAASCVGRRALRLAKVCSRGLRKHLFLRDWAGKNWRVCRAEVAVRNTDGSRTDVAEVKHTRWRLAARRIKRQCVAKWRCITLWVQRTAVAALLGDGLAEHSASFRLHKCMDIYMPGKGTTGDVTWSWTWQLIIMNLI